MALSWYENGRKRGDPWREQGGLTQNVGKSNPYHKQLDAADFVEEKITTARQLMRGPVRTLIPTTTLPEVQSFLRIHRIRHVPIVDTISNTFEGIVSDRDVLRQLAAGRESFLDWVNNSNGSSIFVSDFMTKKVLVAPPEERIVNIARAMFSEKLGCMPIVDESENLVGIITRSDILRLIMRTAPVDYWL